jgi:hypothetical protein
MKVFLFFFFSLIVYNTVYSQQLITMRDNTKISATIQGIEGDRLKLKEGAVTLALVSGVYYTDSVSLMRDDILIQQLIRKNIVVYYNDVPVLKKEIAGLDIPSQTPAASENKNETENFTISEPAENNFGIGIGANYGFLGGQLQYFPSKNIGLFAGGGFAFIGFGYAIGAEVFLQPDKRVSPFFSGMYGTNGVIAVEGFSEANKIYSGFSIGFGVRFDNARNPKNHFKVQMLIPFRKQFDQDINTLKNNPNIVFENEPWPVLLSFGYHFGNRSHSN